MRFKKIKKRIKKKMNEPSDKIAPENKCGDKIKYAKEVHPKDAK